jgi:4-hydroxy-3-methylbut-2-enyl diphosphate reductase
MVMVNIITRKFKKVFNNFKNSFVYGGHLISLGAVGIALTFIILIDKPILFYPLFVIYFLTLVSLLYDRYKEEKNDYLTNPERTKFLKKYFRKLSSIILIVTMVIVIILVINNNKNSFFFLLLLAMAIFFYTKYLKSLTSIIIGFKNLSFSLITSSLLIFTSFYYFYDFLNFTFFIIFSFCFLRMMVNTIFLDIKDMGSDKKNCLKTFPIVFGYEKTILVLKMISLLSGLLLIFGFLFNFIPTYSLVLLLVIPYSFYYFKKSKKAKNFYLVNYVLADAEFILWPISVIIGKVIL